MISRLFIHSPLILAPRLPNPRALIVLAFVLAALPAQAQDDDNNAIDDIPHITIVGSAEGEVVPDLATITLGVSTEKPSAKAASEANAPIAQAIVAEAKAEGVAAADIATRSITLTQTFDEVHDVNGRYTGRKPRGFEAGILFEIRIRDLAKAGTLAQNLVEKGANHFDGIAFSVEHPQPILDKLTAEAVKSARQRAQMVAEAAGVGLGRVLLIERPGATGGSPFIAARGATKAMPAALPPPMPIEAGTTGFSATMEVTWAIEGK